MSRNYDILTSVPYNSTLQDDQEPQSLSIMENDLETEKNFEEIDVYNTLTENDEDLHLSEYEDLHQIDSSQRLSLENFEQKNFNRTRVDNKVFKSFQEKFPINLHRSSSYFDEDDDYFEIENGLRLSKINQRKSSSVAKKSEKQDLNNKKIYQELNIIHNKLVVRLNKKKNLIFSSNFDLHKGRISSTTKERRSCQAKRVKVKSR